MLHKTRKSPRKFMVTWMLSLFAICAYIPGCTGPRPASQEQINALRILAIQATPPMAIPGTKIQLKALVASPWVRDVTYEWFACTSPGEINAGCAKSDKATSLGTSATASFTIPKDFLPAKPSALTAFRGRYLPVTLVAKAGPLQETATKRIVVALLQSNKNPTLTDLQLYQDKQKNPLLSPWRLSAGARCEFRPTVAKDSRQTYPTFDTSGKLHQVQEELFFSWYVTGGTLHNGRTSDHEKPNKSWTTPRDLPTETNGKAHVYMIVRDGRGGVDWRHREMTLLR